MGVLAAVLALTVVAVPFGGAANPDIDSFELDGDAADGGATGADWNTLNPSSNQAGGSLTRFYTADPNGSLDTGFTTGGSKDVNDVSQWKWEQADVTPAKDDIVDAYAASYVEDGNLILYFGQNRDLDNSGDANVGFWFLQNDVSLGANGAFNGSHVDGDLLVQSEFTNGGDVSGIKVFKWQSGSLVDVTGGNASQCADGKLGTKLACAIVNTSTISTGWRGDLTEPYFFEGGLNVSALFSGATMPCFSTFLTNTRTSQSENAQLKDFAFGGLDTCGSIVIKKDTQPDDSASKFDFTSNIAGSTSFKLGDGESRTMEKLNAGTYTVAETTPASPWVFDSVSCSKGSQYVTANGASLQIALPLLGNVECTYVNKRKPQVKLVKDFDGTPTTIDLKLGDTVKGTFSADGDTGFFDVDPGSFTASEAFKGNDAGLYDSTSKCVKNGSDPGFGAGVQQPFTVANGDVVVCTFHNVRKTVKVKTIKDFVGTPASITIGAGPASKAISGDDSVEATVEAGKTYTFSETLSDAQKALYGTTLQCTGDQGATAGSYSRDVAVGTSDVTCTFVNTRKTGTLQVNKDFVGTSGDKAVTLKRDSTTITTTSTDYTGTPVAVDSGTYTVSEDFVNAADGALYTQEIRCYKSGQQAPAYGAGASQQVTVGGGEAWVCDLRNTRKQVTVTVQKQYVGTPTQVQLFVGGTTGNASKSGDQVSAKVDAGSDVAVGESAVPADYDAFIACGNDAAAAGSSKQLTDVTTDTTCVVTNKERPRVKVTKQLSPAADPGRFDLKIGGTTYDNGGNGYGDGGTTGVQHVAPGSYAIGEAGHTGTDVSLYAASTECSGATLVNGSVTVDYGANVSCTITNTRSTGLVTVVKRYVGDPTAVTLFIGDSEKSVSTDGASHQRTLNTGTQVTLGEKSVPAGYDAFIRCGNDAFAPGSTATVTVPEGGTTCVVENRQLPLVSVTKQLDPESDPGRFDLQVGGVTQKADAGDGGTTGPVAVAPGSTSVGEAAGTATSLADYDAQIACDSGKGSAQAGATSYPFDVAYGDKVACTITNTRHTGTLEIRKVYVTPEGQVAPSPYASVALKLDGTTKKTVSANDTTGPMTVPTGSHAAAEAFVDPAKADLYDTTVACTRGDETVGSAGEGNRSATVDVANGDAVVCTFTNTRKPSSITVDKTALTTSLPEPGGTFTYQVVVTNTSSADAVTLTAASFADVPAMDEGSLDCPQAGESFADGSIVLDPGESATCTFRVTIVGQPGSYPDTVTVTGKDEDGRDVSGSDEASVEITNVAPSIDVTKDVVGKTSLQAPGGTFTYRVTIANTSLVEDVTITSLADFVDTDGSVNGTGTPGSAITINGLDCTLPFTIAKGGSRVCTFTANVSGGAGTYDDVVVVGGSDDDGTQVTGDDDARVTLTSTPPPPPPPAPSPKIDVQVVKDATAKVTLGSNGKATITYSVLVRNNGPDTATNVTLADAAPSGVVFGQITKQPDFGSCSVSPALLTCSLGTMGPGVQTLIELTATVDRVGTIVNTATGTGSGGPDTNPGNNTDDAQTVVVAPFNPPTPKPKPQIKPELCSTLRVTQKMLKASGKPQVIRARVTQGSKPVAGAKVTITGPGIRVTVRTNKQGVAVVKIHPSKAGIIRLTITNKKACNTQRIGVVGVFEPPVTG